MNIGITDDPKDPRLKKGVDEEKTGQNEVYLVLSEAERAKGFIRPLRRSYIHVGVGGKEVSDDMTTHGRTGTACGVQTMMGLALSETYARDPQFYGATYCVGCSKHLPVQEFVWDKDGEVVGS